MSCGLLSIERACGPIFVGLTSVQIISPADVDTYPRRGVSGLYESDLVLKAGATLTDVAIDPGSGAWNMDSQTSDRGDVYRNSVAFRLRKDRSAQVVFLSRLHNRRVHLLITDVYGHKRLLMDMRRQVQASNGPRGGQNNYGYTFTNTESLPPAFLSGQVVTADGNILVSAVLQSPDGNYWRLAIGICEEVIMVPTGSTDVIAGDFRISDEAGNPFSLTVTNCGTMVTTPVAGTPGQIILTAPDGNDYELTVGSCEELITTRQGNDLPDGGIILGG